MTSYLGRNVNLALLLIIMLVIIGVVGITVYFQQQLQNRTVSLGDTSQDLAACQASLQSYQEKFSQAQLKVNETSQDIRKYDQLYEQKVEELQDKQSELLSTVRDLELEKLQSRKFQSLYEDERKTSAQLNVTIESQKRTINDLRDEIDELEAELATC